MTPRFQTSRPCTWVQPRPHQDASARFRTHGPVQPMKHDEPTLLSIVGQKLRKIGRRG